MIDINKLRRLAEEQQWIGRWYDAGCETLMAERNGEHEEVAHLTPIGLVPYLVAVQPALITELLDRLEAVEKERDELRTKITEIEQQEPVGKFIQHPSNGLWEQDGYGDNPEARPLYALPGAQPAPSINEGVRKVTLDFRWESEAQHHIPTIEIEFEPVSPESPNDAKSWQDRDRLAAMLTPEAKP